MSPYRAMLALTSHKREEHRGSDSEKVVLRRTTSSAQEAIPDADRVARHNLI